MKKVLLLFRGKCETNRNVIYPPPPLSTLKYNSSAHQSLHISALDAVDNWQKTLIEPLRNNNIECDIAFATHQSNILEKLKTKMQPKYVCIKGGNKQGDNFRNALAILDPSVTEKGKVVDRDWIVLNDYDRVVLLRFDFQYKFKITDWPKWNEKNAIILTGPEPHSLNPKFFKDFGCDYLFIFDTSRWEDFLKGSDFIEMPHFVAKNLHDNKLPFHYMYDKFYTITNHPLHSYVNWEETPDLDNPLPGISIPPMGTKPTDEQCEEFIKEFGEIVVFNVLGYKK